MDAFERYGDAARNELTDPSRSVTIGPGTPRFELYHFGFSICSQKVRTLLAEKGAAYIAHELAPTENYRPGYVHLRLHAAGERADRLAEAHTMRTSVATEGFDACVVPTLVDLERRRAVVDSALILEYLEREVPSPPMIPTALADPVRDEVRINDGIPHPGILYGFHANDPRPGFWIDAMDGVYDRKRAVLERLIEENRDDTALVRAYRAKIAKEMAGKAIQKDPASMEGVLDEFRALLANLDSTLDRRDGPWVCGSAFTLADCVWGVTLYRIQWLGHAPLWDPHPRVRDYAHRLYERPSIRSAVIDWSHAMPPSPHTTEIDRRPAA